jgi:hypothetical protein
MFFFKKQTTNSNLAFSKKIRSLIFSYNKRLGIKGNYNTRGYYEEVSNITNELEGIKKNLQHGFDFLNLICQFKKCRFQSKKRRKFRNLFKLLKQAFYTTKEERFSVRKDKMFYKRQKYMEVFDPDSIINLLKVKSKFQYIYKKGLQYCKLVFKYTGSNFFGTITDSLGNVCFSYSSGFFDGLRTRKEKTTIFVVKQLGELLALRLSTCNAGQITFVPLINHRKIRTFLRFLFSGLKVINTLYFIGILPRRKIMRNGVRLRKVARK